jgi:effector-binding domain-containing protein
MVDQVRIVKLEPMMYASSYGFGDSPEGEAWNRIITFAGQKGIDVGGRRFFGFDNPPPTPGSPNYGYEQWMTLDGDIEPADGIRTGLCPGGTYAVTRCEGVGNIFATWQALVAWVENSKYRMTNQQCLEECLNPGLIVQDPPDFDHLRFDLYLPVVE